MVESPEIGKSFKFLRLGLPKYLLKYKYVGQQKSKKLQNQKLKRTKFRKKYLFCFFFSNVFLTYQIFFVKKFVSKKVLVVKI